MKPPIQDLTRTVFAILAIGGLIAASVWVLWPFFGAAVWATMIVVATWPLLLRAQRLLFGRRWLAVIAMTLPLLFLFFLPFLAAVGSLVDNASEISGWAKALAAVPIPSPPDWLAGLPFVGERLSAAWEQVVLQGPAELSAKVAPYTGRLVGWIAAQVGGFGAALVQFLLTVVITAILYFVGEEAGAGVRRFGRRLAGDRGESSILLAEQAIRGVALGVVVTALIQSVLAGIGLAVAGIPFAAILTALMFILSIAQIGPIPVLALSIGWLYWKGETGWATGLLIWCLPLASLDNVLRPILIKRGADLPLLLIFVGVVGGLISFGLIGIFVGPVVLAVAYKLLEAWVMEEPAES